MRTLTRKNATKVFASVVLVAATASVAGLGTYGSFTSTTSASETVTNGEVVIGLNQHSTLGTTVAATNVVPGDKIQRAVTLTRSEDTEAFGSVKLTTTAGTANLLSSDATNGLQLVVDQCSVAWAQVGTTKQLSCSGTTTLVVGSRPVIGSAIDLGPATTTLNTGGGRGGTSNLRIQLTLPASADNDFQGLSNTIDFTFDATQRTADFS